MVVSVRAISDGLDRLARFCKAKSRRNNAEATRSLIPQPTSIDRGQWAESCCIDPNLIRSSAGRRGRGQFITHNTPGYVKTAKNLGTEDPSKTIEVSIWLNPHNRAEMDAHAQDLYDRNSP